jgi:hypothetical protein
LLLQHFLRDHLYGLRRIEQRAGEFRIGRGIDPDAATAARDVDDVGIGAGAGRLLCLGGERHSQQGKREKRLVPGCGSARMFTAAD